LNFLLLIYLNELESRKIFGKKSVDGARNRNDVALTKFALFNINADDDAWLIRKRQFFQSPRAIAKFGIHLC